MSSREQASLEDMGFPAGSWQSAHITLLPKDWVTPDTKLGNEKIADMNPHLRPVSAMRYRVAPRRSRRVVVVMGLCVAHPTSTATDPSPRTQYLFRPGPVAACPPISTHSRNGFARDRIAACCRGDSPSEESEHQLRVSVEASPLLDLSIGSSSGLARVVPFLRTRRWTLVALCMKGVLNTTPLLPCR